MTWNELSYVNKKVVSVISSDLKLQSKIWATVGDMIIPGNSFGTSRSGGSRPLRAKETMYGLRFSHQKYTLTDFRPVPISIP